MARGYKDYRQVTTAEEPEGKFSVHGTTKMFDDFEDTPLKWRQPPASTGDSIRTADAAYNGSFGMETCTQQVGGVDKYNYMYRYPPSGERRSFELSTYWRTPEQSDISDFAFTLGEVIPTSRQLAQIRYVHDVPGNVHEWQIYTGGAWFPLPGSEELELLRWHELVLACDFASGTFLYARSDRLVFPICDLPLHPTGVGAPAYTYCVIGPYDRAGALTCMHVDDVLVKEL